MPTRKYYQLKYKIDQVILSLLSDAKMNIELPEQTVFLQQGDKANA